MDNDQARPGSSPSNVRIIADVVYTSGGSDAQSLDLYLPSTQDSLVPLVIWIHGGAFISGDKKPNPAAFLVECGFATASINYRLSDEAHSPAQIEDSRSAVRFLRAHAAEYGIDATRFGVWGSSAGGFLAAMVGTTGNLSRFDAGDYLDVSSSVQAVCDWFGPTDLTTLDGPFDTADRCSSVSRLIHFGPASPAAAFLGQPVEQNLQLAFDSSPVAYVTNHAPPFLIVHGDEDPVIPLGQSRQLAEALRGVGVEAAFVIFTATGHGGGLFDSAAALALVQQFFLTHLSENLH